MRKAIIGFATCAATLAAALSAPATCLASGGIDMYRLYNPNSGEHFYTASAGEKANLKAAGWQAEGTGWVAPAEGDAVYRLYNPNGGDHHYTTSPGERNLLVDQGWSDEGVGWSSGGGVAVYRLYNPYAATGAHHYTTSAGERDMLISVGWSYEGVGWYAEAVGSAEPEPVSDAYIVDENSFVVGGLRFTIPAYWQGKVRLTATDNRVDVTAIGQSAGQPTVVSVLLTNSCPLGGWDDLVNSAPEFYELPDGTFAAAYADTFVHVINSLVDGVTAHSAYKISNNAYLFMNCDAGSRSMDMSTIVDLRSLGAGIDAADLYFGDISRYKTFVELWSSATWV